MMNRRDVLGTTAAAFGPFGLGEMDSLDVDFEDVEDDPEAMAGKNFNLVLQGNADAVLGAKQDGDRTVVSEWYGSTQGWFQGGYKSQQVTILPSHDHSSQSGDGETQSGDSPVATMRGLMKLTRPEYEVTKTSSYRVALQGVVTSCCAEDFRFEGQFKSVQATGELQGTAIKGTLTSKTDLGWPQKARMRGVQVEK